MCISTRLKQALEAKNLTIREFSELSNISYRSAMNYLNEGREPNVEGLIKIYNTLGISITWLLTGNGEMFHTDLQENLISNQEKRLIEWYRAMPENLKDAFFNCF